MVVTKLIQMVTNDCVVHLSLVCVIGEGKSAVCDTFAVLLVGDMLTIMPLLSLGTDQVKMTSSGSWSSSSSRWHVDQEEQQQ